MIGKKEHQSCEEVKNDHRKKTIIAHNKQTSDC